MSTKRPRSQLKLANRFLRTSCAISLSTLINAPTCLSAQERPTQPRGISEAPLNLIPSSANSSAPRTNRLEPSADVAKPKPRQNVQRNRSLSQPRANQPRASSAPKQATNLRAPTARNPEALGAPAQSAGASKPVIDQSIDKAKPEEKPLVAQYCEVIVPQAAQALIDKKNAELDRIRQDLDQQLSEIKRQRQAIEEAERRQQASNARATKDLLAILSKMRPDAAAAQLAAMDETLSAGLVARLEPRIASAILNEMPPAKAARMADSIGGKQNVAR